MTPTNKNLLEKLAPLLLVLVVALAFSVGFLWQKITSLEKGIRVNNPSVTATPDDGRFTEAQAKKVAQVSDSDHIQGPSDAQVFLIVYADLECPVCKTFHPVVKQVMDAFPNKVALVFRHFPLDLLHTKARTEAQATECVASLAGNGAFWSYVEKIYSVTPSNNKLDMTLLPQMAAQVKVDKTKFNACLGSDEAKNAVEEDYQSGITAGVTGTPTTFVVNKKGEIWPVNGLVPAVTLKTVVEQALNN